MILPNDFVFEVVNTKYECKLIDKKYHIWSLGQDYDMCQRNHDVGVWDLQPVRNHISCNLWHYLYSLEMPDEETVVDSLEEVM